jgi:hypothetical protein
VVAHCSMGVLSDSVSSVVAPTYFRCGIFFVGMDAASAEGRFKVVPLRAMRYLTYAVPASGAHRGYGPQVG